MKGIPAMRRVHCCVAFPAFAATAIGIGCDRATTPEAEPTAADAAPAVETDIGGPGLNVVLVSVDTTRADHLACYGHPDASTPNIDRLAEEGTRFAWCISSVPLTLPSHTTMLSGSYPFVHGARDNGIFVVDQSNELIPELLQAKGYSTHAEVSAVVLNHKYGMDQGFDTYNDIEPQKAELRRHAIERPSADEESDEPEGSPMAIEMRAPEVEADRKADEVADKAVAYLQERAEDGRPFFLFAHFFDPHWPFEAPEEFNEQFRDDPYLAEIAFFDHHLGRMVDTLRESGLAENTLLILTSDHGEGRGQHGEMTHSTFLYDATLHVPLIMWGPGHIPAGQVVENQVRLVDLAPTILDFLDMERTQQMQGTSLLPLVADPDYRVRLACYAETLVPQNSLSYSPLRALRDDDWKFILAPRNELYKVAEDRQELFNVARVESQLVEDMKQEMWDLIADAPEPPGGRAAWRAPEPDEVRKLAALGYVSASVMQDPDLMAGSELDHFEPQGVNPKDRIEVIECWAGGLGAYNIGEFEAAELMFRRFVELEPDNPTGLSYLGRILMHLQRYDESIVMFRQAIAMADDNFMDYRSLGTLLLVQGEHDEAARCFTRAIELEPEDAAVRLNLGMIYAADGRYEDALAEYDVALEIAPEETRLHLHRGIALRSLKRLDEAEASIVEAIRLDPDYARPHEQLALVRWQTGRRAEAMEQLELAIARLPDEALLRMTLGELHASSNEIEQAGEAFAAAVELTPDDAVARSRLGGNLVRQERLSEGIEHLRKAVELDPQLPAALFELARALEESGELSESLGTYRRFLELRPRFAIGYIRAADVAVRRDDSTTAVDLLRTGYALMPDNIVIGNDLAWRLATVPDPAVRDGEQAVRLAEYVNSLKGSESCNELDTLAAAYAEVGRFPEAVSAAERALMYAVQADQPELIAAIEARLDLFRQGKPYHGP